MTAKIKASGDGLKVTIGNAAEDALEINQTAKTIKGINGYSLMGTGPAFSASGGAQTVTAGTTVKAVMTVEAFDTDGDFDLAQSRFAPQVEGYYQVNGSITSGVSTAAASQAALIYKNGLNNGGAIVGQLAGLTTTSSVSILIYMNGTTDYLELYGRNSANANFGGAIFSASLVRAA